MLRPTQLAKTAMLSCATLALALALAQPAQADLDIIKLGNEIGYDTLIKRLDKEIQTNPKSSDAYRKRALARESAGGTVDRYPAIIKDVDKAIALDPKSKEARLAQAEVLSSLMLISNDKALKPKIIAAYEAAQKLAPNDMEIGLQRIRTCAYIFDDKSQAISDAEKLSKQYPHSAEPLLLLGQILAANKQYERAQESLDRAALVEPARKAEIEQEGQSNGVGARLTATRQIAAINAQNGGSGCTTAQDYLKRAELYGQLNDKALAIKDCDKSISLDPNCAEAYRLRGYLHGIMPQQDNKAAKADLDKAIALSKPDAGLFATRAHQAFSEWRLADAIADYGKAIELSPKSSSLYSTRARMYNFSDKPNEALADACKAIELDEKNGFGFLERSHAYETLGKKVEAAKDLASAHALGCYERECSLTIKSRQ